MSIRDSDSDVVNEGQRATVPYTRGRVDPTGLPYPEHTPVGPPQPMPLIDHARDGHIGFPLGHARTPAPPILHEGNGANPEHTLIPPRPVQTWDAEKTLALGRVVIALERAGLHEAVDVAVRAFLET